MRKEGIGFKMALTLCLFFLSSVYWAYPAASAPPLCRAVPPLTRPAASFGVEGLFKSICTASCGSSPSVSCSIVGTCTAVDQNCAAGEQGYVQCGSDFTYCPICPLNCSEFNHGLCIYHWDPESQCCLSGGRFCPGFCL